MLVRWFPIPEQTRGFTWETWEGYRVVVIELVLVVLLLS
jgi:hypothetical protein